MAFEKLLKLGSRVGDVAADGGLGTIQMGGDILRGEFVDIAQQECGALTRSEDGEPGFKQQAALFAQNLRLRTGSVADMKALRHLVQFGEVHAAVAAKMIESGVGGDAGEPMRGFLQIFQLLFAGEGLDEGFLRQVLGVGDVADDAIDEQENPLHVRLHEEVMPLTSDGIDTRVGLSHRLLYRPNWHQPDGGSRPRAGVLRPELNRQTHPKHV